MTPRTLAQPQMLCSGRSDNGEGDRSRRPPGHRGSENASRSALSRDLRLYASLHHPELQARRGPCGSPSSSLGTSMPQAASSSSARAGSLQAMLLRRILAFSWASSCPNPERQCRPEKVGRGPCSQEANHQGVHGAPQALRHPLLQLLAGIFRAPRGHPAQCVGDLVQVGVDSDPSGLGLSRHKLRPTFPTTVCT